MGEAMRKYKVTITRIMLYELEINAADGDAAGEEALEKVSELGDEMDVISDDLCIKEIQLL